METVDQTAPVSKARIWTSRSMSGLVVLFLVFAGVMKFVERAPVVEAFDELGIPLKLSIPIGTILLACTALYSIPGTSVLGAILLTGYHGLSRRRGVYSSAGRRSFVFPRLFSRVLFPTYMAALLWGGLYLREDRLRALIPLRS